MAGKGSKRRLLKKRDPFAGRSYLERGAKERAAIERMDRLITEAKFTKKLTPELEEVMDKLDQRPLKTLSDTEIFLLKRLKKLKKK